MPPKTINAAALPEFNDLITDTGGFGRFQIFSFALILAGINCNGWIQYDTYTTMDPKFKCWTDDAYGNHDFITNTDISIVPSCTKKYFCNNNDTIFWDYDYDNQLTSLDNLGTKYELTCNSFAASSFTGAYFLGATIGSFTLPGLSDVFGRRTIFLYSLAVSMVMFVI